MQLSARDDSHAKQLHCPVAWTTAAGVQLELAAAQHQLAAQVMYLSQLVPAVAQWSAHLVCPKCSAVRLCAAQHAAHVCTAHTTNANGSLQPTECTQRGTAGSPCSSRDRLLKIPQQSWQLASTRWQLYVRTPCSWSLLLHSDAACRCPREALLVSLVCNILRLLLAFVQDSTRSSTVVPAIQLGDCAAAGTSS